MRRPLWVMLLPCVLLLGAALLPTAALEQFIRRAAVTLLASGPQPHGLIAAAAQAPSGSRHWVWALVFALSMLAGSLLRTRPRSRPARLLARSERALFGAMQWVHSGFVGDYVVWMALGLALVASVAMYG